MPANTRPVADIPRFLLPRLTWTTTTLPKSSVTKATLRHSFTRKIQAPSAFRNVSHTSRSSRGLHTASSSAISRHKNASSPHRTTSTSQNALIKSSAPSTRKLSTQAVSTPLRYNGVYATVYKPAHRAFSSTPLQRKSHHFDTLRFVQRLKSEGFNEAQAVAMMRVLNDVIEESIQNLTRTMVLKEDAERTTYTQKVDFAKLRSELANADSTEIQLTRSSHEKLTSDLAKMNSRLRDDIGRTQASVRLDLNLEKGRIREEANTQEMRIKETEARIEQEVAGLRERVEAVKFSTLQWLMGVCTGTAALILGAWRLLM